MKNYMERASYEWSDDSIRLTYTANPQVRKTYLYVQETGYFKTKPSYFTERENLDSFLIVYTISGNGILKIFQKEYEIGPGEIFFIPCMTYHYYACAEDSEWEFLWLHFQGIAARGYYEEYAQNQSPVQQVNEDTVIPDTMKKIICNIQKRERWSDVRISCYITEILTRLLIENEHAAEESGDGPEYLKQTIKYLDQHFKEEISLDFLAKAIGISKYYLLKQFKKYVGTTIGEYLIMKRISYAKELLKYSDEPVGEIAFLCGMNHVSHFINLFQKHEHMTPLQYRKKWK